MLYDLYLDYILVHQVSVYSGLPVNFLKRCSLPSRPQQITHSCYTPLSHSLSSQITDPRESKDPSETDWSAMAVPTHWGHWAAPHSTGQVPAFFSNRPRVLWQKFISNSTRGCKLYSPRRGESHCLHIPIS